MRYYGTVVRPPSEARSYILQITYGCSHNRCTFCGTYLDKPFRPRPVEEVMEDIELARQMRPHTHRVFLADGDAMVLSTQKLVPILDQLSLAFPQLTRVGIYANGRDLLNKSEADLQLLRSKKLSIIYMGLESGSDEVLRRVNKGTTTEVMIQAVHKAKAAGMLTSIIGILGLGGPELSDEHAAETGRVVSAMDPDYFSLLTLMLVPGTELYRQWEQGTFELMSPEAMLAELRQIIQHIDIPTRCVFRTNHASNYVPLSGTLPQDKPRLLTILDEALRQGKSAMRPEAWRAL